ncbi:MAG: hypothetical protein CXT69_03005 [Methanobacteriota archaeon]|jgi:programmed cell death protein 5|nr:MAG: hypothetical protein CXT69_03005 [Euryarchaeota archaeon]
MSVEQDEELLRIRQKRIQALKQQAESQAMDQLQSEESAQVQAAEKDHLNNMMRTILCPEARSRLATVELAYPELAISVKTHLTSLHSQGRIIIPLNESTLKKILSGLQEQRREPTIRRV